MCKELNDMELEAVNGGTVIISEDYSVIGFSTIKEKYKYNCDYDTAYALFRTLYKANKEMSDSKFDRLCKEEFIKANYISAESMIK